MRAGSHLVSVRAGAHRVLRGQGNAAGHNYEQDGHLKVAQSDHVVANPPDAVGDAEKKLTEGFTFEVIDFLLLFKLLSLEVERYELGLVVVLLNVKLDGISEGLPQLWHHCSVHFQSRECFTLSTNGLFHSLQTPPPSHFYVLPKYISEPVLSGFYLSKQL